MLKIMKQSNYDDFTQSKSKLAAEERRQQQLRDSILNADSESRSSAAAASKAALEELKQFTRMDAEVKKTQK